MMVYCHIEQMVEKTVEEKTGGGGKALEEMDLDELDEMEDEEDERVLQQFRCVGGEGRERERERERDSSVPVSTCSV